ncbi:MAG: zinc transporter ZupT [Planctomycetota bacterium]
MPEHFWTAIALTTGAGLATTVGSLLALVIKRPGARFLGFALGFSAGVMIHVSFVELLQGAVDGFSSALGGDATHAGFALAHLAFFAGMGSYFLIDLLVPHEFGAHHDHPAGGEPDPLMRTGLLVALGIGIHNFPEGMATFAGTLADPSLGLAIAVAIAVHNIPEGVAVSVPIYAATGSRGRAFFWSFLSGVTEPIGALVAGFLLLPIIQNPFVMAGVLAAVGGIMVAISLDELIPSARSYGSEHAPIIGAIIGMVVMALSLGLLK